MNITQEQEVSLEEKDRLKINISPHLRAPPRPAPPHQVPPRRVLHYSVSGFDAYSPMMVLSTLLSSE